jgi:putative spermidine/putrescine transport system substrate-binding protein
MKRRSLLIGAGTLALAPLLTSCSGQGQTALRVQLLADSIPSQLLQAFQKQLAQHPKLSFTSKAQLADLYTLLQTWKHPDSPRPNALRLPFIGSKPIAVADLITLGDAWLTAAIQQELIRPLELTALSGWQQLPDLWQNLVRRDRQGLPSSDGKIWAAPYRWGTMVIVYHIKALQSLNLTPTDWSDLWRPELRGKISLPDSSRAVIGLTLKKLGKSMNLTDLAAVPELSSQLQALQQQVKFYDSDNYLQPLLLGDTWAAVGWSTDVLPTMERDHGIAAVIPASGTMLFADLWVSPFTATNATTDLINQWINFCWQPEIATQLSVLSAGVSPVLLENSLALKPSTKLPKALRDNPLRLPTSELIRSSEFLQPQTPDTVEQYQNLWNKTRQVS